MSPRPNLLHRIQTEPHVCATVATTQIATGADLDQAHILAEQVEETLAEARGPTALYALAMAAATLLDEQRPGQDSATSLGAFTHLVAEMLGHGEDAPAPAPGAALEAAARSVA